MKPWRELGCSETPDGNDIRLTERDGEYVILVNGQPLMSSRAHGSEESLASYTCERLATVERPRVLVGGLGMGFTLRAALDLVSSDAIVTVAELLPAVVEWNRGPLGPLANHPLKDRRVRIAVEDVGFTLRANPGRFDAILLDVDNGPSAFTSLNNCGLYDNAGVAAAYAALTVGGTLAVWSAWDDRKFEQRLRFHGFDAESDRVRARREKGGSKHTIFVGVKPATGRRGRRSRR
jgi:spermidine synthase